MHIQLISINVNEKNKKNCLCFIIAQTSEVLGVDNGTIKYVIRITSSTKPVDPQIIKDSKKEIKRDNYNYFNILKERLRKIETKG